MVMFDKNSFWQDCNNCGVCHECESGDLSGGGPFGGEPVTDDESLADRWEGDDD